VLVRGDDHLIVGLAKICWSGTAAQKRAMERIASIDAWCFVETV
jgi:hypothetical protein